MTAGVAVRVTFWPGAGLGLGGVRAIAGLAVVVVMRLAVVVFMLVTVVVVVVVLMLVAAAPASRAARSVSAGHSPFLITRAQSLRNAEPRQVAPVHSRFLPKVTQSLNSL
ncbi:hypothetical protein [Paraburkholderia flagellata]|uniref:hypothetical protein n=1 Tax=Paraburkholderia flagellata TaxID=2883241 RepID=UPI0035716262